MAYKWRGTTLTFGSTVARLRGLTHTKSAPTIDITNTSSTKKEYETGFPEEEIRATVIGSVAVDVDDTGSASITYTDGGSKNIGNCVVASVETTGDVDSPITSTITLRPTGS